MTTQAPTYTETSMEDLMLGDVFTQNVKDEKYYKMTNLVGTDNPKYPIIHAETYKQTNNMLRKKTVTFPTSEGNDTVFVIGNIDNPKIRDIVFPPCAL